ncbi:hypothetical protein J1N35_002545 [Gossypium stocksii]|uniref:SWIM-type domain-containing protein n=1 Tax=Gossypium stocksii TaxID=47602 RepID=A0A9D3WL90_9ROSI|nr:hypothetical protein J1N35_002545 [Gossypium stocksii]
MTLVYHSRPNLIFWVKQPHRPDRGVIDGAYYVDLRKMTCDCRRFPTLRYSCAHAIAAWASARVDCITYVDEVYNLECAYNVWKFEFPPVPSENI